MADVKFEIEDMLGVISTEGSMKKELNLVKWNDRDAKYDIRAWNAAHDRMGKGVTFTKEEIKNLRDLLNEMDLD